MSTLISQVVEGLVAALNSANEKERAEDLTDLERVALAHAAGCGITTRREGMTVKLKTMNEVGFVKREGVWHVYESDRKPVGDSIRVQLPPRTS